MTAHLSNTARTECKNPSRDSHKQLLKRMSARSNEESVCVRTTWRMNTKIKVVKVNSHGIRKYIKKAKRQKKKKKTDKYI